MRPVPLDMLPSELGGGVNKATPVPLDMLPLDLGGAQPQPEEESGFLRQVADVPVGIARGAVSGIRFVADAFGANNPASQALRGSEEYLAGLMSAQAKNDQVEISRIWQEAQDKGLGDQILAGIEAFKVAPIDLLSQAFGTVGVNVVGGLAANLGKLALTGTRLGVAGTRAAQATTGAAMGAGIAKGEIYDTVYQELVNAGAPEDRAELAAMEAQRYGGKNMDQILLSAGLGAVAGSLGAESVIARMLAGKGLAPSIGRIAGAGATEFATEAAQGTQEQLLKNLALQREGFDVPTERGLGIAGTLEGLAGAGVGAGAAALSRVPTPVAPGTPVPPEALPEEIAPQPEAAAPPAEPVVEPVAEPVSEPVVEPPSPAVEQEPIAEEPPPFEMTPIDQPPLPVPEEIIRAEEGIQREAQRIKELESVKPRPTTNLYEFFAYRPKRDKEKGRDYRLDLSEVFDITPDPSLNFIRKKDGKRISDFVSTTELNPWLRGDLQIFGTETAEELAVKEPAAEEYIKERLRNRDYLTEETKLELDSVGESLEQLERELEEYKTDEEKRQAIADILAGIDEEFEFEPPEGAPVEAPVARPERGIREPAPTAGPVTPLAEVETGKPFSFSGFRGRGKTAGEIYTGAQVPVAGKARYVAISEADAREYGDEITQEPVELNNPLVIRTDSDWRTLTRAAGWEFPNPFGQDEATVKRNTDALKQLVQSQGYDGLVIDPSREGDAAKTLMNVFGMPQIVDYTQAEPTAEPQPLQISPEEQVQQDLAAFESALNVQTPAFIAVMPNGRKSTLRPRPISKPQIQLLVSLAKEAIELGMPSSLFATVRSGGVTSVDCSALIAPRTGSLMLGRSWGGSTKAEKLSGLVHELGHTVDYDFEALDLGKLSESSEWDAAHAELEAWYERNPSNIHPLAYPFNKYFDKSIPNKRLESFPQAFAYYFTSPVALQTNAPAAYSAIQSIVERIQNESQPATRAGAAAPTTAPIEVREEGVGKGPEVQPPAGAERADVRRAERLRDQTAVAGRPEIRLRQDNPGGEWLKNKQEDSIEAGLNQFNVPRRFGSVTGTLNRNVLVSVDKLARVKGMRGEQMAENIRPESLQYLSQQMSKTGRLPPSSVEGEDYVPFLNVYQDGTPYVNEGNHRIMVAKRLGWKYIPIQISWFNGAEQAGGNFSPEALLADDARAYEEGYSLENYSKPTQVAPSISPEDKLRADMERDLFRLTPAGQMAPKTGVQGDLFGATGELTPQPPTARRRAAPNQAELPLPDVDVYPMRRNIFGQEVEASWGRQEESKLDTFIHNLQDKMVDVKRVQQQIRNSGKEITDRWNAYLKEELFHGRAAKKTKDFLTFELDPLMKEMEKRGVGMAEFEDYLHNRTAKERNELVAQRDPDNFPDGGSGILTADAEAYLANLTPKQRSDFEALANIVDKITKGTRNLLVKEGHESPDTIANWEAALPNYVPLNRAEADYELSNMGTGVGKGYGVRGAFSRAVVGSERPVVNILANIAMQRERAIVRTEKMRVAQALYGLVLQNPNPGFWLAVDPEAQANPKDLESIAKTMTAMGFSPDSTEVSSILDLARTLMQQPTLRTLSPSSNEVIRRANLALVNSPFALPVRINGSDKYVFFNPNDPIAARMAKSLRNVDADQMDKVLGPIAKITRYFAAINTQYNPIFGVINFLRDAQGALIQLTNTPLNGKQKQVMSGTMPALRGIYEDLRARREGRQVDGEWANLWNQFQDLGGQTGFRDQFSRSEERADALYAVMNPSSWTETKLGKVFTVDGRLKVPLEAARRSVAKPLFDWLSDYNETMENAIRLSAFKTGLDSGLSQEQAASLAKNLTVNFNRKGLIGKQAGALYAFFNASVQGTARMASTLLTTKNGRVILSKTGQRIFYGGLLLGSAQAMLLAAAGFDEDEPPEFIKERNLVIPVGGGNYVTIPMPLGYNVIPNTSRVMTEWAMSGFKDTSKRVAQITGALLEMFNPVGNAGWSWQTFSPTIADPAVALFENRDWTGKPIAKEDFSSLDPTPGYTRARETASWFSKNLSEFLNRASGGTEFKKGLFSPTPDQIDYLIGQLTGGVGREVLKAEQTVTSSFTGEELPTYKIPLVGRFVGDTTGQAAVGNKFYGNLTLLNGHQREIEGRQKTRQNVQDYIQDNPEARLYKMGDRIQRNVSKLRKRRADLLERGASKDQIKAIEAQITRQMQQLNDAVDRLKE